MLGAEARLVFSRHGAPVGFSRLKRPEGAGRAVAI
jgi:hypothetical protein